VAWYRQTLQLRVHHRLQRRDTVTASMRPKECRVVFRCSRYGLTDKLSHRPVHLTALGVTRACPPWWSGVRNWWMRMPGHHRDRGLPILNHPNGYLPGGAAAGRAVGIQGVSLMEICCADYSEAAGILPPSSYGRAVVLAGDLRCRSG